MADPDNFQRVILKFFSPFARKDALQEWQLKFSLSGGGIDNFDDAEATALALAAPVLTLTSGDTYLGGWLHYPPGSNTNDWQAVYDSTAHPGTAGAYTTLGDGNIQQLEVCALLHAVVGTSSKGRAVYLQKHIHDVYGSDTNVGQLLANTADFSTWSTGVGPDDLVTVSPTTGAASDAWEIHGALYTRQLRKGSAPPG